MEGTEVKRKIKKWGEEDNIKIKLGKPVVVFPFGLMLYDKYRAEHGKFGYLNNRLVRIRFCVAS